MPKGRAPEKPKSLFEASDWQKAQAFEDRAYDAISVYSQKPATIQETLQSDPDVRPEVSTFNNVVNFVFDNEDLWKDVGPRIGPALADAAVAMGTGATQAPFDLAYLLMHTADWAIDKYNGGEMEWLGDMPNFAELQGSSDWLAEQLFNQDTNSMAYAFGGLLSPDAGGIAKVASLLQAGDPATIKAMMIGAYPMLTRKAAARPGDVGMWRPTEELDKMKLTPQARKRIDTQKAAEKMEADGVSKLKILETTGWQRNTDGNWGFLLDPSKSKYNPLQDHLKPGFEPRFLDQPWSTKTTLGEVLEFDELYENYPELADLPITIQFKAVEGPNDNELVWEIMGEEGGILGQLSNPTGGTTKIADYQVDLYSAAVDVVDPSSYGVEGIERVVDLHHNTLLHEIQHMVQAIEGWSPGGSTRWENFNTLEKHRINSLMVDLDEIFKQAGESDFDSFIKANGKDEAKRLLREMLPPPHFYASIRTASTQTWDNIGETLVTKFGAVRNDKKIEAGIKALNDKSTYYKNLGYNDTAAKVRAAEDTWYDLVFERYTTIKAKNPGKELSEINNIAVSREWMDWMKNTFPQLSERLNKDVTSADFLTEWNKNFNVDSLAKNAYQQLAGEVQARTAGEYMMFAKKFKYAFKQHYPNATDAEIEEAWARNKYRQYMITGRSVGGERPEIVTSRLPALLEGEQTKAVYREILGVGQQFPDAEQRGKQISGSVGFLDLPLGPGEKSAFETIRQEQYEALLGSDMLVDDDVLTGLPEF